MSTSRRKFIQQGAIGTTSLFGALYLSNGFARTPRPVSNPLQDISRELVNTWGQTLLRLQVKDPNDPNYGTIIYPPENVIHGRMGECIYPFLHLAAHTGNHAYTDAAVLLFRWMERTVSQDDGSWLNEPKAGSWKGTTVFGTIALAEAVKQHGNLLAPSIKQEMLARLQKAADFIYNNFTIEYGNINYPISATYALTLVGELLQVQKFTERGKELAHKALSYFTAKNNFLYGEGGPNNAPSAKGCYSVDLGYNVEESLPSLVLYGLLTKDDAVLQQAKRSMETHMEFMLPDGGWDNSWGTRNYKWTYWGSRTSDGCQSAYALLSQGNPVFYKAAFANTQLLRSCTHEGILHGGLHYATHGAPVSLHHTFCHLKALVTILDHGIPVPAVEMRKVQLPREIKYGAKFFPDIQTGLIAKGAFRATITGYDRNYKAFKGGHASGGALSMLWHEKAGIILAASMNEYQLYEANNMQADTDPLDMPLTPRIELLEDGKLYMNIHDFTASIKTETNQDGIIVHTTSRLVNKDQQEPTSGAIHCEVSYHFTNDTVSMHYRHNGHDAVRIIVPVISASTEHMQLTGDKTATISRNSVKLQINADKPLQVLPTTGKRVFNFVPGLEAIPFCVIDNEVVVSITCIV